jgi:hypothetical protein
MRPSLHDFGFVYCSGGGPPEYSLNARLHAQNRDAIFNAAGALFAKRALAPNHAQYLDRCTRVAKHYPRHLVQIYWIFLSAKIHQQKRPRQHGNIWKRGARTDLCTLAGPAARPDLDNFPAQHLPPLAVPIGSRR